LGCSRPKLLDTKVLWHIFLVLKIFAVVPSFLTLGLLCFSKHDLVDRSDCFERRNILSCRLRNPPLYELQDYWCAKLTLQHL
jgi:hypothetical protein